MAANAERFAEIYDTYVDRIYAFIYYRVSHRETAEDLTSVVFMKALDAFTRFDGQHTQAWLYRIARNSVIDHYRTHRPNVDLEAAQDVASPSNPARDAETRLQLERVRAELDTLPDEQRDILIMRVWDSLSHAEIAAILGKTEASVKMMFSRSVRALQSKLPLAAFILFITFHPHA